MRPMWRRPNLEPAAFYSGRGERPSPDFCAEIRGRTPVPPENAASAEIVSTCPSPPPGKGFQQSNGRCHRLPIRGRKDRPGTFSGRTDLRERLRIPRVDYGMATLATRVDGRRSPVRRPSPVRLRLEALEERCVPAAWSPQDPGGPPSRACGGAAPATSSPWAAGVILHSNNDGAAGSAKLGDHRQTSTASGGAAPTTSSPWAGFGGVIRTPATTALAGSPSFGDHAEPQRRLGERPQRRLRRGRQRH